MFNHTHMFDLSPTTARQWHQIGDLTFKVKQSGQPLHLKDLLDDYQPAMSLHSSAAQLLYQPLTNVTPVSCVLAAAA